MKNIRIVDAYHHKEHTQWISNLNFYVDELNTFRKELNKVIYIQSERSSIQELAEIYIEIIQDKENEIEQIKFTINNHEQLISNQATPLLDDAAWDHTGIRSQMEELDTYFHRLKKNVRRFVKKYLIHYKEVG